MVDALKDSGDDALRTMAEEIEKAASETRESRFDLSEDDVFGFVSGLFEGVTIERKGLSRKIYDAEESMSLQSKLVRSEGDDPHSDEAVNEAYDGAGDVYKLFWEEFERDSLDGKGLPLISSVHVRRKYNNAFWNGSQMAYGDGDGKIFVRFTQSLAVIGHELSHGVVQFSGGLNYVNQSGALNEHVADVFGCLSEQYKHNQTADQADWLVGKEILAPGMNGKALRSMKAPGTAYNDPKIGKDPQPDHMDRYVNTSRDNGGVHINSGIPNKAFYLLSVDLGGHAWKKAGKIWYTALQELQNPDATFSEWAKLTHKVAGRLFGEDSDEAKATQKAWRGVGLLKEGGDAAVASGGTASGDGSASAVAAQEGWFSRFLRFLGFK